MFKITIITLGKLKGPAFRELESEYLKRLPPMAKVNFVELPEESYRPGQEDKARKKEAARILKQISPEQFVVALDEKGKSVSSQLFAMKFAGHRASGQEIVFVIGSGIGLDEKIKHRANWLFSLSPLTFTHNFARVLIEEQIYRALTILTEKKYHK
ncbi:MAG: 23S rRNA (pseudouridine(1915)-N(3))-methyltransferase RlmH [Patescibacteria group bacterium]|nr:23S rRNA (pseudouridine(1915)-N(3))-methyltransferase RlmH [Patescibacteria group bacterium]